MINDERPGASMSDWGTWLARNSILAFMLCSGAWWVATYVLQPTLADNRENIKQVIVNNTTMADAIERLAASYTAFQSVRAVDMENSRRLVDLQERQVKAQEDSNKIQSALLDATRNGAWNHQKGGGTE